MRGLSPTIQLAQDRLRDFMDNFSPTWPELQQVIGLDVKKIKKLLKQKAGPNMYASVVLEKLGVDGFDTTLARLNELRGLSHASGTPEQAAVKKESRDDQGTSALEAAVVCKQRYRDVRKQLNLTSDQMTDRMNAAPNVRRAFGTGALAVAMSPSGLKTIAPQYVKDIDDAVAWVESSANGADLNDTEHDGLDACEPPRATARRSTQTKPVKPETTTPKAAPGHLLGKNPSPCAPEFPTDPDMPIQNKALQLFDKFKAHQGYTEKAASLALGYGASSVATMRHALKRGSLGEQSARNLIDAINMRSSTPDQKQASGIKPCQAVAALDTTADAMDAIAAGAPNHDIKTTVKDETPQSSQSFPSEASIRERSKAYLQDLLGVDEDALRAMKPAIEMLLVARRNGITARVVVDDVEMRG